MIQILEMSYWKQMAIRISATILMVAFLVVVYALIVYGIVQSKGTQT